MATPFLILLKIRYLGVGCDICVYTVPTFSRFSVKKGPGSHPVHYLLLQQEVHVQDARRLVQQLKKDRRGDVVEEVAHQPELLIITAQGAELEDQGVCFAL